MSDLPDSFAAEVPSSSATSLAADQESTTLSSILKVISDAEGVLTDVERALERLESGSHSTCELCGEPIPEAVLSQSPLTRRCGAHDS